MEGYSAKVISVTCHVPADPGKPFTWDIKEMNWNLTDEKEIAAFEQLRQVCQKEEIGNFVKALYEAEYFIRHIAKRKKLNKSVSKRKKLTSIEKELNLFNSPLFHRPNISVPQKSTSTSMKPHPPFHYTPLIDKEEIIEKIRKAKEDHS